MNPNGDRDICGGGLGGLEAGCRSCSEHDFFSKRFRFRMMTISTRSIARSRTPSFPRAHPYLSGEIESVRLDMGKLRLIPLKLEAQGVWTPEEHYWGEEEEPIEEWAKPIIARGPRPAFEMEQIVPGQIPGDFDSDPILQSSQLMDAGDRLAAARP